MKSKLVLRGTNEQDEKVLIALELVSADNKVNIYVFPEKAATEAFENQMFNKWRNGEAILFPEGYQTIERDLKLTESLLPDHLKVERTDVIQRAQTEWQFVVLSDKLNRAYQSELEDLKAAVEKLTAYDSKVWESLKSFWGKVQTQVRERNLFRDHANALRQNTNQLFDKMKEMRKSLDKEFEEKSQTHYNSFKQTLTDMKDRVEKGMNLTTIFNELKDLQRKFRDTKFTRDHRSKVWKELDNMFKVVKEKKFGPNANQNNSAMDRLQNRLNGLLEAIKRMENSINRDKGDLKFQDRKIANSGGQLEAQIRQAKIKMIEERIRSKEEKLADMYKTKTELEKRIADQAKKDARKADQERIEAAKLEAKAKIAEEMKAAELERDKQSDKLEKAAEAITGGGEEATNAEEQKGETILAAIAATGSDVGEQIIDTMENAVDTVKAIAEVIGGKIAEKVEEVREEVQEAFAGGEETVEEIKLDADALKRKRREEEE